MKHLKIFETAALFEAARATLDLPNVSLVEATMGVNYLPYVAPVAHDYSQDYFTLVALGNGSIGIRSVANASYDNDNPAHYAESAYNNTNSYENSSLLYSTDNGTTWHNFSYVDQTPEDLEDSDYLYSDISVQTGDKILLKGIRYDWISDTNNFYIYSTCNFNAEGNIMSLIHGDAFINKTTFVNNQQNDLHGYYAFYSLFLNNTHLINAENLIMPATTLAECCYYNMFNGCTNLLTSPILPATDLSGAYACYGYMFCNCSSLTSITCLAEIFGEDDEFDDWVNSIATSGTFTKSSNATWTTGTSGIPSGWTIQNAE